MHILAASANNLPDKNTHGTLLTGTLVSTSMCTHTNTHVHTFTCIRFSLKLRADVDFGEGLSHSALGLLPRLLATFLAYYNARLKKAMVDQIRGGAQKVHGGSKPRWGSKSSWGI